jgi:hypothetical protein
MTRLTDVAQYISGPVSLVTAALNLVTALRRRQRSPSGPTEHRGTSGSATPTRPSAAPLMRGIWTPLRTTAIPLSARMESNNAGYLLSRSRMRRSSSPRSPASADPVRPLA